MCVLSGCSCYCGEVLLVFVGKVSGFENMVCLEKVVFVGRLLGIFDGCWVKCVFYGLGSWVCGFCRIFGVVCLYCFLLGRVGFGFGVVVGVFLKVEGF